MGGVIFLGGEAEERVVHDMHHMSDSRWHTTGGVGQELV